MFLLIGANIAASIAVKKIDRLEGELKEAYIQIGCLHEELAQVNAEYEYLYSEYEIMNRIADSLQVQFYILNDKNKRLTLALARANKKIAVLENKKAEIKAAESATTVYSSNKKVNDFIIRNTPLAVKIHTESLNKIPIEIVLAQAALESAWQTSKMSVKGYNDFGKKYFHSHWHDESGNPYRAKTKFLGIRNGKKTEYYGKYRDDDDNDLFCYFKTRELGWEYHKIHLLGKRYSALQYSTPKSWEEAQRIGGFTVEKTDPNYESRKKAWENAVKHWKTAFMRWAFGLQACGYATDQQYAMKLIRVVKKYNMEKVQA